MRWAALMCLGCAAQPVRSLPLIPEVRGAVRSTRTGELVLKCTPFDAEVALDGVSQGDCRDFNGEPRGLKVGPRSRRVEVKKLGFRTWETWLAVDETRVLMTVTLEPTGEGR